MNDLWSVRNLCAKYSKILVTGGAGFIGSHIVEALADKGHMVFVLDNLESTTHGNNATRPKNIESLQGDIEFVHNDVRNEKVLFECIQEVDAIFHEAAVGGLGLSMYQIHSCIDPNCGGTAKLLDILVNKEHNVKKVVLASSMAVYGEGTYDCEECGVIYPNIRAEQQLTQKIWEIQCPNCGKTALPLPTNESKPLKPASVYSISKRTQEETCLLIGKLYGIPTIALRYFVTYGPRQSMRNPYSGVCSIWSTRLLSNKLPIIYEDGLQSRDFIYVKDIVQANLLALEKNNGNYLAMNVGTGRQIKITELASELIQAYDVNISPEINYLYRKGDVRHLFADISLIKRKLGFTPKYTLQEGLQQFEAWSREMFKAGEFTDKFEEAHKELENKKLLS